MAMFNMLLATIKHIFSWFWERMRTKKISCKTTVQSKHSCFLLCGAVVVPIITIVAIPVITVASAYRMVKRYVFAKLKKTEQKTVFITTAQETGPEKKVLGCWVYNGSSDMILIYKTPEFYLAQKSGLLVWCRARGCFLNNVIYYTDGPRRQRLLYDHFDSMYISLDFYRL